MGLTYRDAGVDRKAGAEAVERVSQQVEATFSSEVVTALGSFGAAFAPGLSAYQEPTFVATTDGVGTKLKVAKLMEEYDTIGIDLVAMSVNDLVVQGAKPLFFLDYLATSNLIPEQVEEIVAGISRGCQEAGAALIGGEMAELPGVYRPAEYDLAGFAVGIVDRSDLITGEQIKAGDQIIGLQASGLHSNGYSLARRVLFDLAGYDIDTELDNLESPLGQELLKPTRIYVQNILELVSEFEIRGLAHITGGGLVENIPRILPANLKAVLDTTSWSTLPIFELLQSEGEIASQEMYRTFNMGLGLVIVVAPSEVDAVMERLGVLGEVAYQIGEVVTGDSVVELRGI